MSNIHKIRLSFVLYSFCWLDLIWFFYMCLILFFSFRTVVITILPVKVYVWVFVASIFDAYLPFSILSQLFSLTFIYVRQIIPDNEIQLWQQTLLFHLPHLPLFNTHTHTQIQTNSFTFIEYVFVCWWCYMCMCLIYWH